MAKLALIRRCPAASLCPESDRAGAAGRDFAGRADCAIHAKSLRVQGKRVSLMLSRGCIGYFSDAPNSQRLLTPLMKTVYPSTGNIIALVGNDAEGDLSRRVKAAMQQATALPVHSINAPSARTFIDFSDHLSYWNEGFVGMMVTDTAFFRNEAHRTENDTPGGLDYKRMAEMVFAVGKAVLLAAQRQGGVGLAYPAAFSPLQRNCGRCFLHGKARRRLRWRARRVWFRSSALRRPHLPTQWPRRVVCWSS